MLDTTTMYINMYTSMYVTTIQRALKTTTILCFLFHKRLNVVRPLALVTTIVEKT